MTGEPTIKVMVVAIIGTAIGTVTVGSIRTTLGFRFTKEWTFPHRDTVTFASETKGITRRADTGGRVRHRAGRFRFVQSATTKGTSSGEVAEEGIESTFEHTRTGLGHVPHF